MARITGKNAAIYGVLARTTVSVAATMTDAGDHLNYTYGSNKYWNPNIPPVITKQAGGVGPFVAVSAVLYTVDYVNGKITFLSANGAADVIKINGIEYMTLQAIGDMFDWTLDTKIGIADATAFGDQFETKLSSHRGWAATASGYHVSGFWFDAFNGTGGANPEVYVVFYPDIGAGVTSERFIGAGTIDMMLDVKRDAAVTEKMTISGTGQIVRATS